jgi:transcriptional regulator with XRE-family HTH domain
MPITQPQPALALLHDRGLTITRAAALAGISKGAASQYLNGVLTPSAVFMERIASVLGMDVSELFRGEYVTYFRPSR